MVYSEYFNPLSLYRERQGDFYGKLSGVIFQSTLPIQGETIRREKAGKAPEAFQSTLPIQGETMRNNLVPNTFVIFQSTLPIQGET